MNKLSVNLIVKNEELNLKRCLSSVAEIADEIIIVDTGSADKTLEIAESFNAKILFHTWNNNFSEARNIALKNSTGDWILYIDADEVLNSNSIPALKKIIQTPPIAVRCIVRSIGGKLGKDAVMKYPRLFPNDSRIYFEGKIHEQIIPSIQRNKIKTINSEIEIVHFGYDITAEQMYKKLERNLEILRSELNSSPTTYNHLRIAQTLFTLQKYSEAFNHFNFVVQDRTAPAYQKSNALMHLSMIKYFDGELEEAYSLACKGESLSPRKPYLLYLLMKLSLKLNLAKTYEYAKRAEKANRELLEGKIDFENDTALDVTEMYFWNILFAKKNHDKTGLQSLITGRNELNSVECSKHNLALEKIIRDERLDEIEIHSAVELLSQNHLEPILEILKYYPHKECKYKLLRELLNKFSDNTGILNQLGILSNEIADPEEGIEYLERSREIDAQNPSTYFYLISCYAGENQFEKIRTLITTIENKFQKNSEVISRLAILKQRLSVHL